MALNETSHNRRETAASVLKRIGAVVFWLVVWQLVAMTVNSHLLLAGPIDTFARLAQLVVTLRFWNVVLTSFLQIAGGFLLAFAIGLALAAIAHKIALVRTLLKPFMDVVKSTPVVCIIVLLLIWVGSRVVPTVAVTLVVTPAIYFSSLGGFGSLDAKLDEMLRVFKVGGVRKFCAFVWPGILPFLVPTCELVVGMSWKAGVAAELIGTPLGTIGERVYQSKLLLETSSLFSWTLVVIALAFICEKAFLALLKRSGGATQKLALSFGAPAAGDCSENNTSKKAGFTLEGVCAGFGETLVLNGFSHTFAAGTRTCVSGESGLGKTTLLHVLAGILTLRSGSAVLPQRTGMMFQEARLIEEMSALDNVILIAGKWVSREQVAAMLGEVLPPNAASSPVSELSGGQRRRVELVRTLAWPSQACILDEPFASLDAQTREKCAEFVLAHLHGRTLVMASHGDGDAALLDAEKLAL